MAPSGDMETPNFVDDLYKIRILSFTSYRKSLLYAGFKIGQYDNWSLSARFAKANDMFPIQLTEGGEYLNVPDRDKDLKYSKDEYQRVWDRASVKYCFNIEGSVKTFVCGSKQNSTFRRKEIHAMLKSRTVEEINGRDHAEYLELYRATMKRLHEEETLPRNERHKRAINHVFRAIAFAEIRSDLKAAREQDNNADVSQILARVGHVRGQQREDMRYAPRKVEAVKLAEHYSAMEEMSHANPHLRLSHH